MPALSALRTFFPSSKIALVTGTSSHYPVRVKAQRYLSTNANAPWVDLLKAGGIVDEAYTIDLRSPITAASTLRAAVKAFVPDAFVYLPYTDSERLRALAKLLLLRLGGYRGPTFGFFGVPRLRRRSVEVNGLPMYHVAVPPLEVVEAMANAPADAFLREYCRVSAPRHALAHVDALLAEWSFAGHPLIVLSPGATYAHKKWSSDKFLRVVSTLSGARPALRFIVVGLAEDQQFGSHLVSEFPHVARSVCGKCTLEELTAILQRAQLLIGNDGGTVHLAAAVGCPAISITSAVRPDGMWSPLLGICVREQVPCESCGNETLCPRGTNQCISAIKEEVVVAHALHHLDGASRVSNA